MSREAEETVQLYTTAPPDYDHGRTKEVGTLGPAVSGDTMRVVETPETVVHWQVSRYKSGLYVGTADPEAAKRTLENPDQLDR